MFSWLQRLIQIKFTPVIPYPVYVRELFGGHATIIVFGASRNWSCKGETKDEVEKNNPHIVSTLAEIMRIYKIKRALVPKPVFNAKVVTEHELQKEILPNFFRGADADGVILKNPGDAYFLTSADCLCAVFYDQQANAVAGLHCGRDALIDRKCLNEGKDAKREFPSVIDAALTLIGHEKHRDQIVAYLGAGIRPHTFDHPVQNHQFATENQKMIDHLISTATHSYEVNPAVFDEYTGKIDLFALARRQLMTHGVANENIQEDNLDTATSVNQHGEFLLHSNRRDKTKRNLVIVRFNG